MRRFSPNPSYRWPCVTFHLKRSIAITSSDDGAVQRCSLCTCNLQPSISILGASKVAPLWPLASDL